MPSRRHPACAWWRAGSVFDRRRLGPLGRLDFWRALACQWIALAAAFALPFEALFRLQAAPDGPAVQGFLAAWAALAVHHCRCAWRMSARRLRDAGLSPLWLALLAAPPAWPALAALLARKSAPRDPL